MGLPDIKPKYAWILPLVACFWWWAMLIGLLVSWIVSGRQPYYTDYANMSRWIIYLSDVAATDRQPVFICGSALMGVFGVWATYEEYRLRGEKANYLLPYFNRITKCLQFCLVIAMSLSSFFILMVSCFKVTTHTQIHVLFLALFIGFDVVFAIIDLILKLIYNYHYRERYFAICFGITLIWTLCTVAAISFYGIFILVANDQGNASYFYGYSGVHGVDCLLFVWLGFLYSCCGLDTPKSRYEIQKAPYKHLIVGRNHFNRSFGWLTVS
ncbi:DEBR0S6_05446g1_1 [Brettanomyces bruxellensis]|uniref:DEBR0S6_05446g1_1 n=1 Tax=Dekkera bruxellensis TaxID=5007 RepID=A0A7D9H275_DEKBR|nr:DEBR0S6_05446g1_1 [Brettanomyces bruxellensis]